MTPTITDVGDETLQDKYDDESLKTFILFLKRTSRLLDDGDTVAMMEVLVRPPSES